MHQDQQGLCPTNSESKSIKVEYSYMNRSLANFYNVFDSIMFDVKRLQHIDVSFNYLETLDYVKLNLNR